MDALLVEMAGQRWALPAGRVREVLRAAALTGVPQAPAALLGLLQLRGEPVPVLDLGARVGLGARPLAARDHIVVVETSEGRTVGLRVDRPLELASLTASDRRPAEALSPTLAGIPGIAADADGVVLVHDLAGLLRDVEGG